MQIIIEVGNKISQIQTLMVLQTPRTNVNEEQLLKFYLSGHKGSHKEDSYGKPRGSKRL